LTQDNIQGAFVGRRSLLTIAKRRPEVLRELFAD